MADEGRVLPSFFIDRILQKDGTSGSSRLGVDAPPSVLLSPAATHHRAGTDDGGRPGADSLLLPGLPAPDSGIPHHSDPDADPFALLPTTTRQPQRDTPPTPPEELDDAAPEVLSYHTHRDASGVCIGGVEAGYHGGTESCYHDALCGHSEGYGVRGGGEVRPLVGGTGHGGSTAYGGVCGVDGGDRREEGTGGTHLDVNRSTHSPDEPKPEVSDLGLGDDGKKRPRTAFSADQVRSLEQEFQRSKYLSVSKRTEMSRQLGLTEQQIKIWFQNRRTKWKRKYTNNLEILAQQHYLRMGLLPAYPFHPPGGGTKPTSGGFGGMFGAGVGGVRPPFPTHVHPQPAVRLYPPFAAPGQTLPRM